MVALEAVYRLQASLLASTKSMTKRKSMKTRRQRTRWTPAATTQTTITKTKKTTQSTYESTLQTDLLRLVASGLMTPTLRAHLRKEAPRSKESWRTRKELKIKQARPSRAKHWQTQPNHYSSLLRLRNSEKPSLLRIKELALNPVKRKRPWHARLSKTSSCIWVALGLAAIKRLPRHYKPLHRAVPTCSLGSLSQEVAWTTKESRQQIRCRCQAWCSHLPSHPLASELVCWTHICRRKATQQSPRLTNWLTLSKRVAVRAKRTAFTLRWAPVSSCLITSRLACTTLCTMQVPPKRLLCLQIPTSKSTWPQACTCNTTRVQ